MAAVMMMLAGCSAEKVADRLREAADNISTQTAAETESYVAEKEDLSFLKGTYTGYDGSVIIIHEDGKADYFWGNEYTDDNTWKYSDGKLSIRLTSERCTITADISEETVNDVFMLASESPMWNAEIFIKYSDEDETLTIEQFQSIAIVESNDTPTENSETEVSETTAAQSLSHDGIRPEFREMMESYEAFFDEYVTFMDMYNKSDKTDMSLLMEYLDYINKYAEFMDKINNIDESQMSDAECLYYAEVTLRVNQKLLSVM